MSPSENRFLSALPPVEFDRLTARMTTVTLGRGAPVYRPGGPLDYVYFPCSGMLSAVVVMQDGATAEVAAIGREGVAGASALLGAAISAERVFCQIPPCECYRMPAVEFAAEVARGGPLRDAAFQYLRGLLTVSARLTACACLHSNDERLAMWLLRCRDAVGADEFLLTHEFLATMLGVRRATVTVAAGIHQQTGLISYKGGRIRVIDPEGLAAAACECYAVIRDAFRSAPS